MEIKPWLAVYHNLQNDLECHQWLRGKLQFEIEKNRFSSLAGSCNTLTTSKHVITTRNWHQTYYFTILRTITTTSKRRQKVFFVTNIHTLMCSWHQVPEVEAEVSEIATCVHKFSRTQSWPPHFQEDHQQLYLNANASFSTGEPELFSF